MRVYKKIQVIMIALALSASAAYAQEGKIVPRSKTDINFSFAPVVRKTAPAVVNIFTKQHITVMENVSPLMNDPFFQQFFGQQGFALGGRPREAEVSSLGSGVIIDPKGFIVTANHVIKNAQKITVILSNKEEYDAKVIMKDPKTDLAFLKIDTSEVLPFLEMRDSDTVEIGDLVLAIGNPFGVGQTVTNGIISALARHAEGVSDYQYFIQTDAAINPGNSGGALVTTDGKLVGINTAIYSKSGGSQGIGFAIPSNMVRSMLASKVEDGRVVHPWIGISVQPVTLEIAESLGLKTTQEVIIRNVYPGSPAEKMGLKAGDIIKLVNGAPVAGPDDLQYRLVLAKIGESVKLEMLKDGKTNIISIETIAPPNNPKPDLYTIKGHNPLDGITLGNLSPALALDLGLNDMASGVVVVSVADSINRINIGWERGDLILDINNTKITSTSQLAKVMSDAGHEWKISYQRAGRINSLTVRM